MSSFSRRLSIPLFAAALVASTALSGCTGLTPVYGDRGTTEQTMALNFAAPNSELEQIVYQDLARKFGLSDSPGAPKVSIRVAVGSRALAQSQTTDPAVSQLLTATGVIRITRDGQPVLTTTRQATATYTDNGQILGENAAFTTASQQAAHALADTLELTIIAALAPAAKAS